MKKRLLDILVLSDIHLGTYSCKAAELLQYLNSVTPKKLILNGDIIDFMNFKKQFWTTTHTEIVNHFFEWSKKGTEVIYLTGNHDDILKKFNGFESQNFKIKNEYLLSIGNAKALIFHGDAFDSVLKTSKYFKLGSIAYDWLLLIDTIYNIPGKIFNKAPKYWAVKTKKRLNSVKLFVSKFEQMAVEHGIKEKVNYVICGHIHQSKIALDGSIKYLNSGDWVENLTALEFNQNQWVLFDFKKDFAQKASKVISIRIPENHKNLKTILLNFKRAV